MLSARTRVRGAMVTRRRVASMPFSSGMVTSMTTRSGWSFSASSTASRPLAASPDDLHVGLRGENHFEALADQHVVVGKKDSDHIFSLCNAGVSSGADTSMVTPAPGCDWMVISPPALRARARMPLRPIPPDSAACKPLPLS